MNHPIFLWSYDFAPEEYQKMSSNGGDEDWIILIPFSLKDDFFKYGTPHWISSMNGGMDELIEHIDMENGDVLLIVSHS